MGALGGGGTSLQSTDQQTVSQTGSTKASDQASGGFRSSINNYYALDAGQLTASQDAGGGTSWQTWAAIGAVALVGIVIWRKVGK